jgi:hypothetical protein
MIEQHGADLPGTEWLRIVSADCPRSLNPSVALHELCDPYHPGLDEVMM